MDIGYTLQMYNNNYVISLILYFVISFMYKNYTSYTTDNNIILNILFFVYRCEYGAKTRISVEY